MDELQLDCEIREGVGSSAARRLRAKGFVPGVIYGHERKPEVVAVSAGAFQRLQSSVGGRTVVIALEVREGGRHRKENVIVKEVQREATSSRVLNVDFQRVSLRERVRVNVPVVLTGLAVGVDKGGVLDQVTHEMEVECPAAQIPESFEVDVAKLEIGDVLTAADVELPERVALLTAGDTVVATLVPPRVEEEVAEEAAIAEPELIGREPREEEEGEA